jgi:ferredoxin-like protein FixX
METTEFWTGLDWILAEILSPNTALLKEASINFEYGYGDLVLINFEDRQINQVIKKKSNTIILCYESIMNGSDVDWIKIKDFYESKKLYIQKQEKGIFLLSIPIAYSKEDVNNLITNCPVTCYEITEEDIMDSDDENDDEGGIFHLN